MGRDSFEMLMIRCAYFHAMASFYCGNVVFPLTIEIPEQPYLSEDTCLGIINVLSREVEEDCLKLFPLFSFESLTFFASFFDCDFILAYILQQLWTNERNVIAVLKVSLHVYGIRDHFTKLVLDSVKSYLHTTESYVFDLTTIIYQSGEKKALRVLKKKLRDITRQRKLFFSRFELRCASCESGVSFNYKGPVSRIVFLKCCNRPIHISKCFEEFISNSFDRSVFCPFCRTRWFNGVPILDMVNRPFCTNESLRYLTDHIKYIREFSSDKAFD